MIWGMDRFRMCLIMSLWRGGGMDFWNGCFGVDFDIDLVWGIIMK